MNQDSAFFEALIRQIQSIQYEYQQLITVMRKSERTNQHWNNANERNSIFFECAKTLRSASADLISFIQDNGRNNTMHIHTIRVNVPDKAPETIFRILKRESVEFHIIVDDFITKAVSFLQLANSSGISEFERLFSSGTKHLNVLQGAADCLQEELVKNNISYNYFTVQETKTTSNEEIDLDNVLSEFEVASNSVSNSISNNNNVEKPYLGYDDEYELYSNSNSSNQQDTLNTIDQLTEEFEALTSTQSSQENNEIENNQIKPEEIKNENIQQQQPQQPQPVRPRGKGSFRMRGGNRGRGNPSPRRGNGPGGIRGRGGMIRGSNNNHNNLPTKNNNQQHNNNDNQNNNENNGLNNENLEKLLNYKEKLEKTADDLQEILFNTDIDEIEGCEMATKFVPTAKSLLTEMTNMEEFLISIGSIHVSKPLRTVTLHYLHICKEYFLQELSDDEKNLINENNKQFKDMLIPVSKNQLPPSQSTINQNNNNNLNENNNLNDNNNILYENNQKFQQESQQNQIIEEETIIDNDDDDNKNDVDHSDNQMDSNLANDKFISDHSENLINKIEEEEEEKQSFTSTIQKEQNDHEMEENKIIHEQPQLQINDKRDDLSVSFNEPQNFNKKPEIKPRTETFTLSRSNEGKAKQNSFIKPQRRANTTVNEQKPSFAKFSAGEITRSSSRSSFLMGARRSCQVKQEDIESEEKSSKPDQQQQQQQQQMPKQLGRTDQRIRATEEIFSSEKVYLSTLQRMIWVNLFFYLLLNSNY